MARTITDEKIKLSIIVDGNPAQKELFELEKSVRDLNTQQKELRKEKQLLEKQGLRDTERYKAVTAAIKDNTLAITASKAKMGELQNQLGLTGLTMGQLQQKATALRAVLRNMVPGSENFRNVQNELNQVTGRIDELRGRATAARFSIGSMADSFNRYQGIAISAIAATTGIVLSIQKIIDINGKLSDAQADVMKTTGMNKAEVDELTKSFGLLQTRTSRIDLLKIAEQGGRIGILKEDIGEFVNVMNKAAVALGDSFTGGAEEVANKLGKIKFLFEETKNLNVDEAYNSIGSAINDLGANGVASEANIAEFTTRIGSLTDVLKPTIQETLALGTAFEESGIEAEVSARAYNIFMKQASTESAKFAQVMGLTTKEVEAMINKNPLDFMMKFAKGMRGMDATQTAKTLDFLGVNADGANKVIGAMGNNMARFRELIDLSNKSFEKANSLTLEYEIKNNNLAATLEKISKKVSGMFSSETFTNWLGGAALWFAKFIGATEDADGSITKLRNSLAFTAKIIAVLIGSMISYNIGAKVALLVTNGLTASTTLYNIAVKAELFWLSLKKAALMVQIPLMNLLGISTDRATASLARLNSVAKLSPFGALLAIITAAVVAYKMFADEAKEAATAQSMFADTIKQTKALVEKESQTFMTLMKVVQDTTASTEARTEALKKAKEIGGEYVEGLTIENANTAEGKKILDAYILSLERKIQLQVLESKQQLLIDKINAEKIKTSKEVIEEYGEWYDGFFKRILGAPIKSVTETTENAVKRQKQGLLELQNQLNLTNAEMKAFLKQNPNIIKTIGGDATSDFTAPGETGTGTETKNPNSSLQELLKLRLDNERRFADESLKLQRQIEDDKIAIMQDGYEKENAIEALRYQREIDDLNRQKVNALEMAKLDEDIAKAKEDKDVTKYNALLNIKKFWEQKNQDLDAKMQELTEGKFAIHQTKLATIQEKGAKTQLQLDKEAFDRAKVIRETKFQEQLAALGDNQRAKDKLTQEFNKSELDIEEAFLKELIGKLNEIVGKGNIERIDLDLLTPEQVDKFKEQAEKAGLSLQELINKRNQLLHGEAVDNAQALGVAQQSTDILGFTSDNWQVFFDNLSKGKMGIDEMVFAVGALTNAYSMYNEFLSANENAQLRTYQRNSDAKKRKLKQELDSGMINQRQYKAGIEKIDDDLDKKKLDLEYKQAKRQKIIAAMNIVNSTAQAIIGIWAQFPKFDFGATAAIMSGVVGALGALQLATVLAQPLPARGAEKGLYPEYVKREQDGKVFRTTGTSGMKTGLYSKPRLLVGEGPGDMPEMVIDKRSYAELSPYTKSLLIRELRGVRGFEQGYYNPASMRIETPASSGAPSSNDQLLQMVLGVVAQNTEVMKNLRDNGVTGKFFRNDLKSMKEINEGIKDYNELRNKAKK